MLLHPLVEIRAKVDFLQGSHLDAVPNRFGCFDDTPTKPNANMQFFVFFLVWSRPGEGPANARPDCWILDQSLRGAKNMLLGLSEVVDATGFQNGASCTVKHREDQRNCQRN